MNASEKGRVGRPGEDRVKFGKIRAQVKPHLRVEAEELAKKHSGIRSLSQCVEAALAYYLLKVREAGGRLDERNFPVTPEGAGGESSASHPPRPVREQTPVRPGKTRAIR